MWSPLDPPYADGFTTITRTSATWVPVGPVRTSPPVRSKNGYAFCQASASATAPPPTVRAVIAGVGAFVERLALTDSPEWAESVNGNPIAA